MQTNYSPMVSVLMTAYNREKYISEAIESVLASSYKSFELIVVDDGSTDATVSIARSYAQKDDRVCVYVNEKNLGDYPNRNRAASYARGKYIKYLDSDDIMYAHCLDVMVSAMEKYPEAGFGLSSMGDAKKPYPVCISPADTYQEHFANYGHFDRSPGSSIIRNEAFTQVKGFSGKRMIGDFEFWFKIARSFPMVKFPVDLYWSRQHEEQESGSSYARSYNQLKEQVIKEALSYETCPLSKEEKKSILLSLRKLKFKNKLSNLIR